MMRDGNETFSSHLVHAAFKVSDIEILQFYLSVFVSFEWVVLIFINNA